MSKDNEIINIKIMDAIKCIILLAILIILLNIRVAIEKWGYELAFTKVTTVEHVYNYDVESYGVIKLNDKFINLEE